jgi:hypothetical protein
MKIYLAGTSVSAPRKEKKLQFLFKKGHKLHSFFHCEEGFEKKWFKMNKRNKVDLFLDSGAFSAKAQNIEINIQNYISFILKNEQYISLYSNLDVIGDPKQTWKNQLIMEKAGLSPIPVFHYGENESWLRKYLKKGYDYISLGGMVPISTPALMMWLDQIFTKHLTDKKGIPIIKVHGFGLTSFSLIFRYPWYSIDSTSWVVTGRLGSIFIPEFKQGKWQYNTPPLKIAVSSKSPLVKNAGKHISTLSPKQKQIFLTFLEKEGYVLGKSEFKKEGKEYILKENEKWVGKKPSNKTQKGEVEVIIEPGVSNVYQLRDEINIKYYLELEKEFLSWPWKFKIPNAQRKLF